MKLTLKIKLLPNKEQAQTLLGTLKEANAACEHISEIAFEKRIFNQFKIHKEVYHPVKGSFNLSAQMVVRCISKVADAYKLDRKVKRSFRQLGAITYDARILSYNGTIVSIWTADGRLKIPFVCHAPHYLPYIKGEADLVTKKGKFYLFQTIEVPDEDIEDIEDFIGVDFGLVEIATLSNGTAYNSKEIEAYREKRQRVRGSLQSKGTKGAKRVLKRLSGKERAHGAVVNHTISKSIVSLAKSEVKGVAIEDLTGIRFSSLRNGKKFRSRVGKWSFFQLRQFIAYKCQMHGVRFEVIEPKYTSKTCNSCLHIGDRNGKKFSCKNCNTITDADVNAAKNIALLGRAVTHVEKPDMLRYIVHP